MAQLRYEGFAMVAHTEPVKSWGDEPCGRKYLPTTTCVSAGGGFAPRPPGYGRGKPEVKTLLNSAPDCAYGAGEMPAASSGATNEQISSPAAASFGAVQQDVDLQDHRRDRTGGSVHPSLDSVEARVSGDLGKAVQ